MHCTTLLRLFSLVSLRLQPFGCRKIVNHLRNLLQPLTHPPSRLASLAALASLARGAFSITTSLPTALERWVV